MIYIREHTPEIAKVAIFDVPFDEDVSYEWPQNTDKLILDYRVESVFRFEESFDGVESFFKKIPSDNIRLQTSDYDFSYVSQCLKRFPSITEKVKEVELYPFYHLGRVMKKSKEQTAQYDSFQYSGAVDRHFIFMNRAVNVARYSLMEQMVKDEEFFKTSYVSWLNRFGAESPIEKTIVLDDSTADKTQHAFPIQYSQALVDIFAESNGLKNDFNPHFVTEKTWRPLLAGHIFLGFGCVGLYSFLEKLGFQMFHDYFDYSFDHIENFEKRLESYLKTIKNFKDQFSVVEFHNVLADTLEMREHNRRVARQLAGQSHQSTIYSLG